MTARRRTTRGRRRAERTTTHGSARIDVPPNGMARLAVISDTHSRPHPNAAEHVAALEPKHILHGGDIGALEVLEPFADIAPLTVVRGNIDGHDHPDSVDVTLYEDDAPLFRILLTHIAVYGVKIRGDAAALAREHGAPLIVCGHSHVPLAARDKGLTVFNPGSIGPRRFHLPITFGLIEISRQNGVQLHHYDCETGRPWHPTSSPIA